MTEPAPAIYLNRAGPNGARLSLSTPERMLAANSSDVPGASMAPDLCLYSVTNVNWAVWSSIMHEATSEHNVDAAVLLRRDIPPIEPASSDELKRRREVVERILRRRERVGPIGIRADELLHEARSESEE